MLYDATTQFQTVANPRGVWSYGYAPAGGVDYALVLFDSHGSGVVPGSGVWTRSDYNTTGTPCIWRNLDSMAQYGVQPGQLSLHPGPRPEGDFAVLRFTAPPDPDGGSARQTYRLSGRFFAGDSGSTSARIVRGGRFDAPLREFAATDDSPSFRLAVELVPGETLDVVIGHNGDFGFGNTPLELSIELDEAAATPPADLVPESGQYPIERAQYEVLVLDDLGGSGLTDLALAGPLDLREAQEDAATRPVLGAALTWTQSWYTQGLGLGQLLHSVALAPGESTRIAMIDWSRRQSSGATESISESEQLSSDLVRVRSISEVTAAVASEAQEGFSRVINRVEAGQVGYGAGAAVSGSVQGINFAGGSGLAAGYAQGTADVQTRSWTTGRRDISASLAQNIVDSTHQASRLARGRWATIVKEVNQQETERISTRSVTNFNHMHALTVQYWETVQLYRCTVELTRVDALLFVPMKVMVFDRALLQRFRQEIAEAGLNAEVRALKYAQSQTVAISAPAARLDAQGGYWRADRLAWWSQALGYPVADAADQVIELPRGIARDLRFGWWDPAVPVDAVTITWDDGTSSSYIVDDASEANGVFSPRFSAATHGALDRDNGGRDFARVRRIAVRKRTEAAVLAEFGLFFKTGLADKLDYPNLSLVSLVQIPAGLGEVAVFDLHAPPEDSRVLLHLNMHAAHYSRAIWSRLNPATVLSLLTPFSWGLSEPRPVASQVDPSPVAVVGNYLAFRLHPVRGDADAEVWRKFLAERDIRLGQQQESLVPLPTGGVFAEAVLGRANAAEKIDLTRFWNWQDSPIPITAPEIAAIGSGSRATAENPQPGSTPAPVLNIMNAPAMPDPTGLAGVLGALQNGNMFRDMSGLAAAIGAAQAGLARGFDASTAAQAQAAENFKTAANLLTGSLAGRSASAAGGPEMVRNTGNLPATPTNLGGLVGLGRELDRRESAQTTEPPPDKLPVPPNGSVPAQTTQPGPGSSNEKAMLYGTNPPAPKRDVATGQVWIQILVIDAWGAVADANFECTIKDDVSGDLGTLGGRWRKRAESTGDEGRLPPVSAMRKGIIDLHVQMLSDSYDGLVSDVVDLQAVDVPYDFPSGSRFARFTARQDVDEVKVTVSSGESLADKVANSLSGTAGVGAEYEIVKLSLQGTYGRNWETEMNKSQSTAKEYTLKVPRASIQVKQTAPRI